MNAILKSDKLDPLLMLGLLSSAAFVAEGMTYLVYMQDINEESRRSGDIFFGFIPLSGKRLVVVQASLFLLSFCQLLGKSIMVSVLNQMGGKTQVIVVSLGEMGFYFFWKVIRRDFRYW